MKRIIYILIFILLTSACSKEIPLTPAISFFGENAEVLEKTAIFRLVLANMSDSTEVVVPVSFEGTAEKGVEYSVSREAFVVSAKSPVDSIVVTTLDFGTKNYVRMIVSPPEGFEAGKYLSCVSFLHYIEETNEAQ